MIFFEKQLLLIPILTLTISVDPIAALPTTTGRRAAISGDSSIQNGADNNFMITHNVRVIDIRSNGDECLLDGECFNRICHNKQCGFPSTHPCETDAECRSGVCRKNSKLLLDSSSSRTKICHQRRLRNVEKQKHKESLKTKN